MKMIIMLYDFYKIFSNYKFSTGILQPNNYIYMI